VESKRTYQVLARSDPNGLLSLPKIPHLKSIRQSIPLRSTLWNYSCTGTRRAGVPAADAGDEPNRERERERGSGKW
jgi:hypothetical protein